MSLGPLWDLPPKNDGFCLAILDPQALHALVKSRFIVSVQEAENPAETISPLVWAVNLGDSCLITQVELSIEPEVADGVVYPHVFVDFYCLDSEIKQRMCSRSKRMSMSLAKKKIAAVLDFSRQAEVSLNFPYNQYWTANWKLGYETPELEAERLGPPTNVSLMTFNRPLSFSLLTALNQLQYLQVVLSHAVDSAFLALEQEPPHAILDLLPTT